MDAKTRPEVTIEAVITRADGTVENLGIIAQSESGNEEKLGTIMCNLKNWFKKTSS